MLLKLEGKDSYTRVLYPAKLAIEYDNKNKDIFGQEWSLEITSQALFFLRRILGNVFHFN